MRSSFQGCRVQGAESFPTLSGFESELSGLGVQQFANFMIIRVIVVIIIMVIVVLIIVVIMVPWGLGFGGLQRRKGSGVLGPGHGC